MFAWHVCLCVCVCVCVCVYLEREREGLCVCVFALLALRFMSFTLSEMIFCARILPSRALLCAIQQTFTVSITISASLSLSLCFSHVSLANSFYSSQD